MSPQAILALIEGISTAVPALIDLFKTAQAGGTVTQAQVDSALSGYATARAALVAEIAAQKPSTAS